MFSVFTAPNGFPQAGQFALPLNWSISSRTRQYSSLRLVARCNDEVDIPVAASDRDRLKRTFDYDAELYDRARPSYPDEIFDDLVALCGLEPGAPILEIGCGTGKATLSLAERRVRVVCIELGENLAARSCATTSGSRSSRDGC